MLSDFAEAFTLLAADAFSDPEGGILMQTTAPERFSAAITDMLGSKDEQAGQLFPHTTPCLLHPLSITLRPGDFIRREKTGALYRVLTFSQEMETPACATFSFAQTLLERVVDDACHS